MKAVVTKQVGCTKVLNTYPVKPHESKESKENVDSCPKQPYQLLDHFAKIHNLKN